jgi:hypothetical protein
MKDFFYLEGAYLILGAIILAVTLFVTTRPFMGKGSVKKGMISVSLVILLAVFAHFFITKNRMNSVKEAFNSNKVVLCENRIYTKGANFVTIKNNGSWKIIDDNFISPNYTRKFFLARCIVKK